MGENAGAVPRESTYDELVEWWEDLWAQDERSRSWALIVPTPEGWGVEPLLERLRAEVERPRDDRPAKALIVDPPDGLGAMGTQTEWLSNAVESVWAGQTLYAVGGHRAEGVVSAALDLASIAQVLNVPFGIAAGVVNRLLPLLIYGRDHVQAGQLDAVSRVAAGVARYASSLPVLLVIEHADRLDPRLVQRFVSRLVYAEQARILAVIQAPSESEIVALLTRGDRFGRMAERVVAVGVEDMTEPARRRLVRSLRPEWPEDVVGRLAERLATFADVERVVAKDVFADVVALPTLRLGESGSMTC